MAHDLETFEDGTTAFVTARQDAWHQLGTVTRDCLTAEDVMTTAYLGGWNVRLLPLTAAEVTSDGVTTLEVPDHYATVRTHPKTSKPEVLAVVGKDYTVVQNEEHCELLNLLVDEGGAHFETAGSLRGGRETFVTMKLPKHVTIAGTDDIELYLAAMSSHDGTTAWRVIVTPVRIVCANTQRMALHSARASYSIRHTKSARTKISEVRTALGIVWQYCDAFETAAEHLIQETLTDAQFNGIVDQLWPYDPDDEGKRAERNRQRRTSTLHQLFADTDTNSAIRGTRWAGLQAITEYLDHYAPAKTPDARAHRVLTSQALGAKKQTAYELLAAA
ncbi:DUF932 domain-containing protein [Qaidamihabitans albus]|uniref:DUF932 domain-containing protein n=1 Tax=Qaidamihabitans albus TaxID=2795733 RepID=UPI0018F1567D|nr:DUF932 domain-containing protein [Qaidamihabitans albus]